MVDKQHSLSQSELDNRAQKPYRHPDLWMDDGSIVLQAENTQFRVHRSMLSRHSSVFRDMFSVPQPTLSSDEQNMIEGCPIVHLPDSAGDVSCLLSTLYDHQLHIDRQPLSFPIVAAMLRLGSKYDFQHLRNEALFRLRSEFPTTLEDWDELDGSFTLIAERPGVLVDIINLANEQGLLSILPCAYYIYVLNVDLDIERFFNGWWRADGSKAVLLPEAQKACIIGRQRILEQLPGATLSWLNSYNDDPAMGCISRRECQMALQKLAISTFRPFVDFGLCLESWYDVKTGDLCGACCHNAEVSHGDGRSDMWDMMPENFGFLPWDELKKLDRC